MTYEPNWQSLKQHPIPNWFHNAKLGVLIHWGPASVPAWAPIDGNLHELVNEKGFEYYFIHNPYVEWYYNTIRIKGSPSERYHAETYGADFSYFNFAPMFNEAIKSWEPDNWSKLFEQAGVKYVVFVAKHHDGFLLWPSDHRNPFHEAYQTTRDVTGELTHVVRQRGMKMGIYYSGGLDWTFNNSVIRDIPSHFGCVAQSPEFVAYVDTHWRELIDLFEPDILWGDIGYPAGADLPRLFADYYNRFPEGLINDRFAQDLPDEMDPSETVTNPTNEHYDFVTPEYSSFNHIRKEKWETNRGIGYSFAYNLNDNEETTLSYAALVHLLADVVSKNGNLLLGVSPMADGTIPPLQKQRLEELGSWLDTNGEAIFGTRPWVSAESTSKEEIPVRFTQKGNAVYAVLLGIPLERTISIRLLHVHEGATIELMGYDGSLHYEHVGSDLKVSLPALDESAPAHTLRITPAPLWLGLESNETV